MYSPDLDCFRPFDSRPLGPDIRRIGAEQISVWTEEGGPGHPSTFRMTAENFKSTQIDCVWSAAWHRQDWEAIKSVCSHSPWLVSGTCLSQQCRLRLQVSSLEVYVPLVRVVNFYAPIHLTYKYLTQGFSLGQLCRFRAGFFERRHKNSSTKKLKLRNFPL